MPVVGWICPEHGERGLDHRCDRLTDPVEEELERALRFADKPPYIPRLSWSLVTNCVRQTHLQAQVPYFTNGSISAMWKGRVVHQWLKERPGWRTEFRIGMNPDDEPPLLFPEVFEEWPEGVPFVGKCDRLKEDLSEIEDSTTSDPYGDFRHSSKAIQLNGYSLMVERKFGKRPTKLWIQFLGKAAQREPVPLLSEAEILANKPGDGAYSVRDNIRMHLLYLRDNDFNVLGLGGRTMYISKRAGTSSCDRCLVKTVLGGCDDIERNAQL